ncbi:hypothetical protein [Methylobacterium sp.]|uniref:hypothetical protein n=1 Tax=Methylobacterium sp. TaxID=409 RepID=UPI00257D2BA0|nr:hypothetical protein [Methylobacterium sp.]
MTNQKPEPATTTISGLIRKRAELFSEAERIRDRLAEIRNDLGALDRTLAVLGHTGNLDDAMPRQKRQVLFGQGELSRSLMRELRDADGPMTSRELAQGILALRGDDVRDRRLISEVTRRVSKSLRAHREEGRVRSSTDASGNLLWSRRLGRGEFVDPTQMPPSGVAEN